MNLRTPPISTPIEERLATYSANVNQSLETYLPSASTSPERLHEAMRYAALGQGKRMRPLLCFGVGEALGVTAEQLMPAACAIEMVHAYSLIHDDLPAMDDDDLRRGRPSLHIAFDEGTAILAGDALLPLAFEVLTSHTDHRTALQVRELAKACGSQGMAGGQALDLAAVGSRLDLSALEQMHQLKTGALIECAVRMACYLAADADDHLEPLTQYAQHLGLAFQIHDDVLDEEGDEAELGKPQGSDAAQNKSTYPALLGIARSRAKAKAHCESALQALDHLEGDTELLRYLARLSVTRTH